MNPIREFPIMPVIVDDAERFYDRERSRVEFEYNRDRQIMRGPKPSKPKKKSIEQRLAEKRKNKTAFK